MITVNDLGKIIKGKTLYNRTSYYIGTVKIGETLKYDYDDFILVSSWYDPCYNQDFEDNPKQSKKCSSESEAIDFLLERTVEHINSLLK